MLVYHLTSIHQKLLVFIYHCSPKPPPQIAVCQNHPDAIRSVSAGAKRGISECQHQFRHERWNCSQAPLPQLAPAPPPFSSTIRRGKPRPLSPELLPGAPAAAGPRPAPFLQHYQER